MMTESDETPPLPMEESVDSKIDRPTTDQSAEIKRILQPSEDSTSEPELTPEPELEKSAPQVPSEPEPEPTPEPEPESEKPAPQVPSEPAPTPESEPEKAAPKVAPKSEETQIIVPVVADNKTPQTPVFGKTSHSPIEIFHSIGDIHGWAPGLIAYLITNKLAVIEIDGYPLQDDNGVLDAKALEHTFPNPIKRLKMSGQPPQAGLADQPGFDDSGLNSTGHGSIKARWIADPNVALIQIGDVYDRADHSELAAEILRQLIIDAPGRVFVMVGNHEQFMLENDYDNWYFNEVRNAFTESATSPSSNSRNHFRFRPDPWDGITSDERARATFQRYVNSTWTLFLTQGAVMQKLGWLDTKMKLSPMLEAGWSGYTHSRLIKSEFEKSSEVTIPGALTALVIGDSLFHHAEPAAHRTDDGQGLVNPLPKSMKTVDSKSNNILIRMYSSGHGSLKKSPDAPLLWSRGSSTGAASGQPAAESHLEGLANSWQGLRRIIHGHTPTVGSGDFDSVTSGKSTTVSYLGESLGRQTSKGRANRIRIYNIDEGMSPVYYNGDDSVYNPQRMPTGLRLEKDEFSSLEAKSSASEHIQMNPSNSVHADTRNLWRWGAGEWRSTAKLNWDDSGMLSQSTQQVNHGKWQGFITTDSREGDEIRKQFSKNLAGTTVQRLMVGKIFTDLFRQKSSIQIQQPSKNVLGRVPLVGRLLAEDKIKEAWKETNSVVVLFKENAASGYSLILLNATNKVQDLVIRGKNGEKRHRDESKEFPANSVTLLSINHFERIFIGRNSADIDQSMAEWKDGSNTDSKIIGPVIAYFAHSMKSTNKLEIKESQKISLSPPRQEPPRSNQSGSNQGRQSNTGGHIKKDPWWKKPSQGGVNGQTNSLPSNLGQQRSSNKSVNHSEINNRSGQGQGSPPKPTPPATLESMRSPESSPTDQGRTPPKQDTSTSSRVQNRSNVLSSQQTESPKTLSSQRWENTATPDLNPTSQSSDKKVQNQENSSSRNRKNSSNRNRKNSPPPEQTTNPPEKKIYFTMQKAIFMGELVECKKFIPFEIMEKYKLKITFKSKPSQLKPNFTSTYSGTLNFIGLGASSTSGKYKFIYSHNGTSNSTLVFYPEKGFLDAGIKKIMLGKEINDNLIKTIRTLIEEMLE